MVDNWTGLEVVVQKNLQKPQHHICSIIAALKTQKIVILLCHTISVLYYFTFHKMLKEFLKMAHPETEISTYKRELLDKCRIALKKK